MRFGCFVELASETYAVGISSRNCLDVLQEAKAVER